MDIKTYSQLSIFDRHLVWMLLIQTITAMAYYSYVPLIPILETEFMLSKTQIGWMTSFVFIGSSFIAIPSGILVDRFGERKVLLIFSFILIGVLGFFSIANHYFLILLLLLLIGICYGSVTPSTNKHIMDHFPLENRGTMMGIKQMGVPLGSALGSLLIPIISHYYNWRLSILLLTLITLALSIFYLKTTSNKEVAIVKNKSPLKEDLKVVLKNKALLHSIFIIFFFIWVQLSVMTYLVVYLMQDKLIAFSIATVSLVLLQAGGMVGRVMWGFINDKWMNRDRSKMLAVIGIISGTLLIFMVTLPIEHSIILVYFLTFLLGVSTQGWNGIFVVMISEVVSKKYVGLASGVGLSAVYLGAILGTPFSGKLIDYLQDYRAMWAICAVTMLLIGISLFVKPIVNKYTIEAD